MARRDEVLDELRRAVGENRATLAGARSPSGPLGRLLAVAERSRDDLDQVSVVLAAVADAIDRLDQGATLPGDEEASWQAVGAKFDDRGAVARSLVSMTGSFAELVRNSILGDAAMAKWLGVDRSRISQRVAEGSLYSFVAGDQRCFPRWQFRSRRPLPGLKQVLNSFEPAPHPLTVDHWFQTANSDLLVGDEATSPAAWLATGGDPKVAAALAGDL